MIWMLTWIQSNILTSDSGRINLCKMETFKGPNGKQMLYNSEDSYEK